MTTSINDFRSLIVNALSGAVSCTVAPIGGAFDVAELKRQIVAAPIILVAVLRVDSFDVNTNGWKADATFAAYIVTRDTPEVNRDIQALAIVTDVLRVISTPSAFGVPNGPKVIHPVNITADNLYSGSSDSISVALWAVAWTARLVSLT